jgi:hypothetical protein
MATDSGNDEFDWVSAQTACTTFVAFERQGPRINVTSEGTDAHFTAIVNINPAGECRFFVGETEYLAWEVRKMALEVLFFEEQEED